MYWVLYHYAFNEALKQEYATQIREHWEIEKPERMRPQADGSFGPGKTFARTMAGSSVCLCFVLFSLLLRSNS